MKEAVFFDLSDRGKVEVTGSDRASYLHAVLTNHVKRLVPGQGSHAVFLTREGRLVADFFLYCLQDKMLLDVSCGRAEALLGGLDKYLITEDAVLKNVSDRFGMFTLQGPAAHSILGGLTKNAGLPVDSLSIRASKVQNKDVHIILHSWSAYGGFDLVFERAASNEMKNALTQAGCSEGSAGDFEAMRIEAGVPLFGTELDETTIPLEAGLESAIDHDKGCYVGQEVIARIRDRGHVAKKLIRFELEASAVPGKGASIFSNDQEVGRVTSAVLSSLSGKPVGMGYVKWDALGRTELEVQLTGESGRSKLRVKKD